MTRTPCSPIASHASADGLSLEPCPPGFVPTIGGEINKLVSNVFMGRSWGGIHYRSDSLAGVRLGEDVAISILQDLVPNDDRGFRRFPLYSIRWDANSDFSRWWHFMSKPLLIFVLCLFSAANAQIPVTFQYVYDDIGQLTKVIDSTGVVIEYVYDAVGNMLEVRRGSIAAGSLNIFGFTPQQGGAFSTMTITGQGFSATPSANTVRIGGVQASVTAASATSLSVSIPSGAVTGLITVTVGMSSVVSSTPFVVRRGPVITSIQPKTVLAGANVTGFVVTGLDLTASTFSFLPAFAPPNVVPSNLVISADGTSAQMNLLVSTSATGTQTLVASNGTAIVKSSSRLSQIALAWSPIPMRIQTAMA